MATNDNFSAQPPPIYVPSTIILNNYSTLYVEGYAVLIAPWVMGAFADLFLQGILAAQTAKYFTFRDAENINRPFAVLVISLTVLCLLKTAQNIVIVWDTVLANFANPDVSSVLIVTNWVHYTTSLMSAIIATFVQAFFAFRYWMLTRRWYACAVILSGMLVSLVAAIMVIVFIPQLQETTVKRWSLVHFIAAIIVDVLVTTCTAWHLHSQKTAIQPTAQIIDRLVRVTWQTAFPPTIFVIINAVVLESRGLDLVHIAFNMVLPKLYAISLMYTLNLRNEIRGERISNGYSIGSYSYR